MRTVPSRRLVRLAAAATSGTLALLIFPAAWPVLAGLFVLLGLTALLDWWLTPGPAALQVVRLAPERFSVLTGQTVALQVRNRSGAALTVRLRDGVPEEFHPSAAEVSAVAPAEGEARCEYSVRPITRGRFPWGAIHVGYRSLLGLWERRTVVEQAGEARVYPNLSALHRYLLLARADRLETMGIHKVRFRGGEWEFESLRDYATGDDVRRIDWKASARRSRLTVRQMQVERNQTVLLLVDSGRLMTAEVDGAAKLDHAVNAALLLSHVALARGDRVGLCAFSHKVHSWLPPRAHLGQNRLITEALYDLRGDLTETDHGRCLRLVRSRHPKRALLIVLTDFVDAQTAADMVAHLHLASRRHLVLFVAFNDPFLRRAAHARVETARGGFRMAAALDLLHERREVLGRIKQLGAHVVDADPALVAPPLLNEYLAIARRGLL